MFVWLLHIGEQLPVNAAPRTFRYGYLARALAERGHQVLRWAPTFNHYTKCQRFETDRRQDFGDRYAIQFVHSPGYRRNVSLERLRTYRILGERFRRLAAHEVAPDLIVAAIPSLEWAEAAVEFGRLRGIPVVIDVRDLWPDVFLNALPRGGRSLGRFLSPYARMARAACRGATALSATSQDYLDWALCMGGRREQARDSVVPLGFEPESAAPEAIGANIALLRRSGIDPERPTCMFAGLFERSYDLESIVEAAARLAARGQTDLQFVLCGSGSKLLKIRERAARLPNVHCLGWVDTDMLQSVMSISTIGLCAYRSDALQSLPNKPFEYMANRLAIRLEPHGKYCRRACATDVE